MRETAFCVQERVLLRTHIGQEPLPALGDAVSGGKGAASLCTGPLPSLAPLCASVSLFVEMKVP